jgi:hypothetical protein
MAILARLPGIKHFLVVAEVSDGDRIAQLNGTTVDVSSAAYKDAKKAAMEQREKALKEFLVRETGANPGVDLQARLMFLEEPDWEDSDEWDEFDDSDEMDED